ncbi:MAG: protein kinase [Phycisphaerae bacterium]|nr:protein kinase [Phycisphaerae bacterium]
MTELPPSDVSGQVGGPATASNRFQRAAAVFEAVRTLTATEREQALLTQCGADAELLVEVRSLLAFHDRPSETLDTAILKTGVGATIGRYRVTDVLGEGGMGTVYLAIQEEPVRREVALKVIKLGMDTRQVVRRFEAERQAIAQMEHPNVARVLDAGSTSDGRPYFVMELVRGQPITHFCDGHHLPLRGRLRLFLDVCAAVQHAHQKGVIHRDLKPSNILVADVDGRPVAKVIDFGIAKALWRPATDRTFTTTVGDAVGTPDYMSPEQAGSGDVDVRSDVYALGVILYELLVGMTPLRVRLRLRGGSAPVPPLDELRKLVRDEDPVRPLHALTLVDTGAVARARDTDERSLHRGLRGDVEAISMKALALKPSRRYATVAAFSDDLDRHLRDEPVSARVPSAAYYLGKFARRHTVTLIASCLVVLAILTGLVLALVGFEQARRDRDLARSAQRREELLSDEVRDELFQRDIDRGRQRAAEGNLNEARDLLWTAISDRPQSLQARWALRELMWAHGPFVGFSFDEPIRSIAALDEELVAVAGFSIGPPVLLDGRTGESRTCEGPSIEALEIAASPDDTTFACGDSDGTITLWNRSTLRYERTVWVGPAGRTPLVYESPGVLIAAMPDGDVRRIRLDRDAPAEIIGSAGAAANRIARSPRGDIAVGCAGGVVLVLSDPDAAGIRTPRIMQPHQRGVIGVAFDHTGDRLASASTARDYRVFDADSLEDLFGGQVFPGTIQDLAFSGDDEDLIIPSWWDTLAVSMLTTEKRSLTPLLGSRMSVSPKGGTLAFCGVSRWTCAILSASREGLVSKVQPERGLVPVAFNLADGCALASGNDELCGVVMEGPERGTVRWSIPNTRSRHAAVSPAGDRVATLNADGTIRVLSVPDGTELASARNAILGEHGTIRFDRSGDRVAWVTRSSGVRITDLSLGTECIAVMPVGSEILGIDFDPAGDRLAVCERSGINRVFGLANDSVITYLQNRSSFVSTFLGDGRTMAMGTWSGDIVFWDPDSGEDRVARGHSAFPSRVAPHPTDPDLLLSCSDDGTVRIWHRELKQDLVALSPYGPRQPIRHVAWSRDGSAFHVVGPDRAVRTYSIPEADRLIDINAGAERHRLEHAARNIAPRLDWH